MGQLIKFKNKKDTFSDSINYIKQICEKDLTLINTIIIEKLDSNIPLIQEISSHLILSGGKRLRPVLTSCCFQMCNNKKLKTNNHIGLAAAVEFIHAATLLHDDVVDDSKNRRGKLTANEVWGNKTSVLVGDFLFSRAFQLMTKYGDVYPRSNCIPSTTSSVELRLFDSSTVMTPSFPTLPIDSAIIAPISESPLEEIVPTCAIS